MYALVKTVHISSAVLSFGLFFLRGLWMLNAPENLQRRWVRILPHLIDTVLLASAVTLAVMSQQYPGVEPWLSAKVVALFLYIALGMIALRPGRDRRVRVLAWVIAMLVFGYIVGTAVMRSPAWLWI
jgi:uncharacterized membrane protein SirB2